LLAGANPNAMTESLNGAPALCIASREGHSDLVSLYLEFGADVNASDDSDIPALSYAARSGHVSVIHLLTIHHAKVLCSVCYLVVIMAIIIGSKSLVVITWEGSCGGVFGYNSPKPEWI